ncbi:hypothetical protein VPNG_04922 [Cytospora leucostoma]|uniref:Uncharacterized protein n=1 Tax=Cytospora leucostoma TaxID=1230097 RepID=A0A423X7U3_9PEZI|nr:hypothetical protein VPNG_04922 [Cytospora leucostoma]
MPSLSNLAVRIGQASTLSRPFSTGTSRPLQSGPFFNLGGLAASREAQYLSKERGIPRTEYSSNAHRIRASEVDPFAPAPGATPGVAAARGAQAADKSRIHTIALADCKARDSLAVQLHAAKEELARTKRELSSLQARSKGVKTTGILIPVLGFMMGFILRQIYREREEQPVKPWQSLSGPLGVQSQQPVSIMHESRHPYRDARSEAHLSENHGLKGFESHPTTSDNTSASILQGLFWASGR